MGFDVSEAKKIPRVTMENVWRVARRANLRLQLAVIGETHAQLNDLVTELRAMLARHADENGKLDGLGMYRAQREMDSLWSHFFKQWKARFFELQTDAAAAPFGVWEWMHNEWFLPQLETASKEERAARKHVKCLMEREDAQNFVFKPQLDEVVNAARQRIYEDGWNLSARLWRLDQESLAGIKRVLYQGIVNGTSAWDLAKQLEEFLGASARCPRWTRARLQDLTKADIANDDPRGLLSDSPNSIAESPCDLARGVAYNALRLARNEINAAHALATDYIMARMPWIEKEEVRLSPDHAERDECDAVAGVHPKGTVLLPIHPHCLCYKVAVLIKPDEFINRLRDWMQGGKWDAMDAYAGKVGGDVANVIADGLFKMLLGLAYGKVA
jgi:hypothetical protein